MTLPQVNHALDGWQDTLYLIKITQSIVNYQVVNTEYAILFEGVVQPLSPEELKIKSTEERSWEWLKIHTKNQLQVGTNDRILFNGNRYKIIGISDYNRFSYYRYEVVKDYE